MSLVECAVCSGRRRRELSLLLASVLLVEDRGGVAVTLSGILKTEGRGATRPSVPNSTIRILQGPGKVVGDETRQPARMVRAAPNTTEHEKVEATAENHLTALQRIGRPRRSRASGLRFWYHVPPSAGALRHVGRHTEGPECHS